jgi:hypothetical protein
VCQFLQKAWKFHKIQQNVQGFSSTSVILSMHQMCPFHVVELSAALRMESWVPKCLPILC